MKKLGEAIKKGKRYLAEKIWVVKLQVRKEWEALEAAFEASDGEFTDAVMNAKEAFIQALRKGLPEIKRKIGEDEGSRFEELVDDLEVQDDAEGFDSAMEELYYWGDDADVWVGASAE